MTQDLVARFETILQTHRLVRQGDSIVIGVSGGRDSMSLLHLFASLQTRWRLSLTVAHLNHCLRGEASEEDEQFVSLWCGRLGVPCKTERRDLSRVHQGGPPEGEPRPSGGDSLEMEARRERYQFFQRVCQAVGATKVALAHTQEDDAETILFRILRGNSGKGLGGIPYKRPLGPVQVIRPLKEVGREEIQRFLSGRHLPWREDRSNADLHYTRNRIRRELLPYLKERFNPRIQEALLRLGKERSELEAFVSSEIERFARRHLRRQSPSDLFLEGKALLKLHPFLQRGLFWRCLEELGLGGGAFKSEHAQIALSLLRRGKGKADLPESVHLEADQEGLHLFYLGKAI